MPATALHPSDTAARGASRSPDSRLFVTADPLRSHLITARELSESRGSSSSERRAQPTRLTSVDRLLAGGLGRGRLVELTGRRSSGRFSIALAALAAATAAEEAAALIDLGNGLDPDCARVAGVVLERLLWIRPEHLKQALIGAEMSLNAGFPLVVLDLGSPPVPGGRGVEASWLRLARAASAHGAALLVSTPYRASGTAADTVLEATPGHAAWGGRGHSPRLLTGLRPQLRLHKLDSRPAHRIEELCLSTPAGLLEVPRERAPRAPARAGRHRPGSSDRRPNTGDPLTASA